MKWQQRLNILAIIGLIFFKPVYAQEVGRPLSDCILQTLNKQQTFSLKALKGKVVYVDFWASWCPPCVKSFPFLNEIHKQYHEQGLQVIGINLDEVYEEAQDFANKHPVDFMLARDETKVCAKDLGVMAMPTSYLVDRKGIIRHIHLGFRSGESDELRQQVKVLLSEFVTKDSES